MQPSEGVSACAEAMNAALMAEGGKGQRKKTQELRFCLRRTCPLP